MTTPILSKRKSDAISNGVLLIGLGIIFYTNSWWPSILILLWASLGIRQYLTGRMYDFMITSLIFGGLLLAYLFKFDWSVLMPVLFVVGGIYIIFREYFFSHDTNGEDKVEEIMEDMDNDKKSS